MVAKLLGKLLASIGVIERGHLVECTREQLVAAHIGQTAIKTKKMIESAKGGVLFLDEAYQLTPAGGGGKDFGREAVETVSGVSCSYEYCMDVSKYS